NNVQIAAPKLAENLHEVSIHSIKAGEIFENCLFKDGSLSNQTLDQTIFRHCKFINVSFENVHFFQLDITEFIFDNFDIDKTELIGAINNQPILKSSKLICYNFAESTLTHVQFPHCINTFSTSNHAKLTRVIFSNSVLGQAEFQETKRKKLWRK